MSNVFILIAAFCLAGAAHAAPIAAVIDFDDPNGVEFTGDPNDLSAGRWQEDGTTVLGYSYLGSGFLQRIGSRIPTQSASASSAFSGFSFKSRNIYFYASDTYYGFDFNSGGGFQWTNGSAFDLHSLDLCGDTGGQTTCSDTLSGLQNIGSGPALSADIVGFKADGSLIRSGWTNLPGSTLVEFDDSWSDLYRVSITSSSFACSFASSCFSPEIDNIVVTIVPVPAAVWLFGSALIGLRWARKARPESSFR